MASAPDPLPAMGSPRSHPSRSAPPELTRRQILRRASAGGLGLGLLESSAQALGPRAPRSPGTGAADGFGPLLDPNEHSLRLPVGFSSRLIAVSGLTVGTTGHVWHGDPDGGATFPTRDGGWVYVSNAERTGGEGGVGVVRFASDGEIVDAYTILSGTTRNCAGGPTPWGTWLSCEETLTGRVWECTPLAPGSQGVARPALGRFAHEAAAVDPAHGRVYLTEDLPDGLLYRFTPSRYPDLSAGTLEAAEVGDPLSEGPIAPGQTRPLTWHVVPDPTLTGAVPTRHQVPAATSFDGGEGCWYHAASVHFTTKGDNRVWVIDTSADTLRIVYDLATSPTPILSGVDNLHVSACGDVYVAEDAPGDLQLVALTPSGSVTPVVEIVGARQSEITGPCLSPAGDRMYFSLQRPGITFEVEGPFLGPAAVPAVGTLGRAANLAALAALGALALRTRTSRPART